MDGTKNAAAAVGGEGKDYCSNLVFTKKWDQDLKKNLCEEDLSKNLCEKNWGHLVVKFWNQCK